MSSSAEAESDAIRNSTKLRGSLTTSVFERRPTKKQRFVSLPWPCALTHTYTRTAIEGGIKATTKSGRRMFVIRAALNDDIALPWAMLRYEPSSPPRSSRFFLVTFTSPASPAFVTPSFFPASKGFTRETPLISRCNQKETMRVSNVVGTRPLALGGFLHDAVIGPS